MTSISPPPFRIYLLRHAKALSARPGELAQHGSEPQKLTIGGPSAPAVGAGTLTMSPGEAFAKGRVNKVSIMIGADRDEINGGVNADAVIATTPEQYRALVSQDCFAAAPLLPIAKDRVTSGRCGGRR